MTLSTSSSRAVSTRTGILAPAARSRRRTSKPSMPGQAHVEDDEVRRLARRDLEALLAGARDGDLVALLLEGVLDPASDRVLVFDDEDGGCHAGMLHRRAANAPARRGSGPGVLTNGPRAESWYPIGRYRAPRHSGPAGEPQPRSRRPSDPEVHDMPTARATLAAEHRELTGKKVARLRHAGRLPAVVYGHGVDSDSVSIDAHEFEQLRRHTGPNALVDLSVDGAKAAAGAGVRGPGPPGQPPGAPRRPLPRPDDRGADGRRPARRHRRIVGDRRPRAARCSTRSSRSASGRCPITCRSRSSTRSSRWSTSTRRSTSATCRSPRT